MFAKSYPSALAARVLPPRKARANHLYDFSVSKAAAVPPAAPNSFSVNRISVLFNWQNFNSCKLFSVFLMKTATTKF